jgi:hypothetical protein
MMPAPLLGTGIYTRLVFRIVLMQNIANSFGPIGCELHLEFQELNFKKFNIRGRLHKNSVKSLNLLMEQNSILGIIDNRSELRSGAKLRVAMLVATARKQAERAIDSSVVRFR